MNFEISSAKIIPFTLSNQDVKDSFLENIIKGDDVPVNIALESQITQINSFFYPIRHFHATYSADWRATSIWEHKEPYVVYDSKTVYIDREGREHSRPGADYTDRSGRYPASGSNAVKHPWTPQQKIVQRTKYKTVVDRTELTNGYIDKEQYIGSVAYYEDDVAQGFKDWIHSFQVENQYLDYADELVKDKKIMHLLGTNEDALSKVKQNIWDIAVSQCKNQIPGDRYCDFDMQASLDGAHMDVILLPVFNIVYQYNKKKYECWCSGIRKDDFLFLEKPIDEELSFERNQLLNEIKEKKNKRLILGIALVVVPIIGLGISLVNLSLIIFAVFIVIEIVLVKLFQQMNQMIQQKEKNIEERQNSLETQKQNVIKILKREDLSPEEKREYIFGKNKEQNIKCSKCGNLINVNSKYCPFCDNEQEKLRCPKCNAELQKGVKFCKKCGCKIG